MPKDIKYAAGQSAIKVGINKLADAVKVTLGPQGNCVVITDYRGNGKPHLTKDGVTVAKNVELNDPVENAGACLIREAALKTVATCGDSTTTSIVLSQALIDAADEAIHEGMSAVQLKKEIQTAAKKVTECIEKQAIPVTNERLKNIATISANNDAVLGELISSAYEAVGREGIVITEESKSVNTSVDVIMGMQFENGYMANHFVTDSVKDQCVLINPYILATEYEITNTASLLNILNPIATKHESLLIIAQNYSDSVLENFKLNHLQGVLKCCLVKAPSFGERRKAMLEDICVLTGATLHSYEDNLALDDLNFSFLGQANKVIVTKDTTTIVDGKGDANMVRKHADALREVIKKYEDDADLNSSSDHKFLQERLSHIVGGICTIHVGGTTELEMKERMDRVEDAVCAVKASVKKGIVRGGGVTYRDIASYDLQPKTTGEQVVAKALLVPYQTLLQNAGISTNEVFVRNGGYDLTTIEKCNDVLDKGIIDPTMACLEAFNNAVSVVLMYLSVACVISPLPTITVM